MTREEAKQYVLQQEPTFLQKAKRISGKQSYVCPVCGSGSGKKGTGIVKDPGNKMHPHYSCFPCKANGRGYYDIIELYAEHSGLDMNDAGLYDSIYRYYGLIIAEGTIDTPRSANKPQEAPKMEQAEEEPKTDYLSYLRACAEANDYSYLQARGISPEVQKRFMIGYDAAWKHPKAPNAPASPRCIIPSSRYTYLARDTRQEVPEKAKDYIKSQVGNNAPPFNLKALTGENPVIFITEGEIDALSVEEMGYTSCGLGGASMAKAFTKKLNENYKGQVFIILPDNDKNKAGDRASEVIEEGLKQIQAHYIVGKLKAKDPNEALVEDREGFKATLDNLYNKALAILEEEKGNEYNALELLDYFKNIENIAPAYEVGTGFPELDKNLYGGLHEGLYIIGAISSLGKTTFSLQLADQVAKSGNDVIFFSLEMSKHEIVAKSISRYTYEIAGNKVLMPSGMMIAKDTQHILNGRRYSSYTDAEKQTIREAISRYENQVAKNLYIYEGRYKGERLTVDHIKQIVANHIEATGKKPLIVIDYLQILAPLNERSTDKQATDENVFCLKEISRDYHIPVFAISSFNRENYTAPVSMQSFKESGAIEYSSDILLGLQYAGMNLLPGEGIEKDKKRAERIRNLIDDIYKKKRNKEPVKIELKCLKNRNGYQFSIVYDMINAFNYFAEEKESNKRLGNTGSGSSPFDDVKGKIEIK